MEEEFLDLLLKLVRELPLADIYQMDAQPASQPIQSSRGIQTALEVLTPTAILTSIAALLPCLMAAACGTIHHVLLSGWLPCMLYCLHLDPQTYNALCLLRLCSAALYPLQCRHGCSAGPVCCIIGDPPVLQPPARPQVVL